MSHKSNFSLSSINLAIDFFFRVGLPLYESRDGEKEIKKEIKIAS